MVLLFSCSSGPILTNWAQVVGWPPVRSYRKNTLAANATKTKAENEGRSEAGCCYVKVSMDGAPYLRKVDLKTYSSYDNLSLELEKMFSCFITGKSSSCKTSTRDRLTDGSRADALQDQEYVLTYEDKDADWMLVGDLPWDIFVHLDISIAFAVVCLCNFGRTSEILIIES
uniref:Auxin-responsive protein n=1 Tax=Aegilops tauschii subsp. strangulata TaxID=200361 RepID=A0A452ZVN0_AEGTS